MPISRLSGLSIGFVLGETRPFRLLLASAIKSG